MTLFHLRSICSCGNLVHVPSCPLFGKCPFCGKCQTTCRLLKTCRKLFHPKRCSEDHQKLVKTYRELCNIIDDFGKRIFAFHCLKKLSEQFLERLAKLNTEYNFTKRQLPVDVNQLKTLETILAKIRRVFIDVKASRTDQPAQPAQPAQQAQPDQPTGN